MSFFNRYDVGVNLGGWISQYKEYDHAHFRSFITEEDIRRIADWGMDHVRLPVDYPVLENDQQPFVYLDSGLAYIDQCLEWCQKFGLALLLDLHRAPGYSFNNLGKVDLFTNPIMQERFISLWQTLATRYRQLGDELAFELLNEIVLPESAPWNELAGRAMRAIRAIDPRRAIMVGGNRYNLAEEMQNLVLPDDPYLVYTFHHYHPLIFTHQRAYWVPALAGLPEIEYPGVITNAREKIKKVPHAQIPLDMPDELPLDRDVLEKTLQPAIEFQHARQAIVYCGEFGAIDQAPLASRINWYRDFIDLLNENKIGRAVWSYKAMDFGLVDEHGRVVSQELIKIVSNR